MRTTNQLRIAELRAEQAIPSITDPLGRHWEQPNRFDIEVDNEHALMSQATFAQLADYSYSQPSGVYAGKMWKMRGRAGWLLCWFGHHSEPGYCSNHYRKILIA